MRLAGPWHYKVLKQYGPGASETPREPIGGTAKLPADWSHELGREFCGRVRYTRAFHRPTNLDPHESVWLVVDGADASAAVSLNGKPLGEFVGYAISFESDVTKLLAAHNELQIDVERPLWTPPYEQALRPGRHGLAGGLTGDVRLEVRARHFIHRLMVELIEAEESEVILRVAGKVVGPERVDPLLLIVTGWYGELLATEVVAGKTFDVATSIERLSRLEPESDGLGGLARLSIRLIEGGLRVWERSLETGHRALRFEVPSSSEGIAHTIAMNGQPCELPLKRCDHQFWQQRLKQDQPGPPGGPDAPLLITDRIFREEEYAHFDRLGLRIVQEVPAAWIDEVCARFAHHPSIVAWAVPREWLQQGAGVERALAWLAGSSRPWVARELLLAEH